MADSAQILGQILATDTALPTSGTLTPSFLYRVPQLTQTISTATPKSAVFPTRTIVSSLIVCNTDSLARTYNLALISNEDIDDDGEATCNQKQILIDTRTLDSKITEIIGLGITISAGDGLYAWASSTLKVSYNLFGFEIS